MEYDLTSIDRHKIPAHVAIIMDGNGRWAKAKGMERTAGHVEGVNTVRRITEIASDIGIKYLTLYAFSTENWKRPQAEVDALMNLIVMAIERETPDLISNNVRLGMIGDIDRMPEFARTRLQACIDSTSGGTGLNLILALSYSSRWELTEACRRIAKKAAAGELNPDDITAETVASNLSAAAMPDPDLLIRTGGDFRISNFLLWQIAYAEIVVVDKFWPDFTKQDFVDCIASFGNRERRFGLTGDQVKDKASSAADTDSN